MLKTIQEINYSLITKEQFENRDLIKWTEISEEEYNKIRFGK